MENWYYEIRDIKPDGKYWVHEVINDPVSSLLDDFDWDLYPSNELNTQNYDLYKDVYDYLVENNPNREFSLIKVVEYELE